MKTLTTKFLSTILGSLLVCTANGAGLVNGTLSGVGVGGGGGGGGTNSTAVAAGSSKITISTNNAFSLVIDANPAAIVTATTVGNVGYLGNTVASSNVLSDGVENYLTGGAGFPSGGANGNTGIGFHALNSLSVGANNVAVGISSLSTMTSAGNNVAVGVGALQNTTGGNNIGIGLSAGSALTTGNNNIDIGNTGVSGEYQTIRVGGVNQTNTFIAGVINGNGLNLTNLQFLKTISGSGFTATTSQNSDGSSNLNLVVSAGGTVTSASVVSANGFGGTVATATTTPAITLTTSVTGIMKGNGTAVSQATAGTDYQAPLALTTTGSSGASTLVGSTLNIPQYSGGGGGTQYWTNNAQGSANNISNLNSGIVYIGAVSAEPTVLTMGNDNEAYGLNSMNLGNSSTLFCTAVGNGAMRIAANDEQDDAFGYEALYASGSAAGLQAMSAFGYKSMFTVSAGTSTVAVGYNSLTLATTLSDDVGIGVHAGESSDFLTDCVLVGYHSGDQAWGNQYSTAIGSHAMYASYYANYDTDIGAYAGAMPSGLTNFNNGVTYSVNVGYQAGMNSSNASSSIFIGPNSGTNRADTLWIDTLASGPDSSYVPLILGYFDLRVLQIGGTLISSNGVGSYASSVGSSTCLNTGTTGITNKLTVNVQVTFTVATGTIGIFNKWGNYAGGQTSVSETTHWILQPGGWITNTASTLTVNAAGAF